MMELLLNEAIYRRVIVELLAQTRKFLWIVTADTRDASGRVTGTSTSQTSPGGYTRTE